MLFVYPKFVNFSGRPGSARNISVKIQLMQGQECAVQVLKKFFEFVTFPPKMIFRQFSVNLVVHRCLRRTVLRLIIIISKFYCKCFPLDELMNFLLRFAGPLSFMTNWKLNFPPIWTTVIIYCLSFIISVVDRKPR